MVISADYFLKKYPEDKYRYLSEIKDMVYKKDIPLESEFKPTQTESTENNTRQNISQNVNRPFIEDYSPYNTPNFLGM